MKQQRYCQISESCLFCLGCFGICFALHRYHKVMRESAKILCDITRSCTKLCVLPPTTEIAQDESSSEIFDEPDTGRLPTLSSCICFLSQQELMVMAIHKSKYATSRFVDIFSIENNSLMDTV